jgi:hypothetical protein
MFLVIDRDGNLAVFQSTEVAERHMETNDFVFDDEFEMCDETGQRYVAEILEPERWDGGILRFLPRGDCDAALPISFLERTRDFSSYVRGLKTLDELRRQLSHAKA